MLKHGPSSEREVNTLCIDTRFDAREKVNTETYWTKHKVRKLVLSKCIKRCLCLFVVDVFSPSSLIGNTITEIKLV